MDEFRLEHVLTAATEREDLTDFGDSDFLEPLTVLLESYRQAPLNDLGRFILRSGVVHSLSMRLRATEWRRRFPEINDELIEQPVVVVGMMRSGTTVVQRLIAADTRFHSVKGWEVGEVAPPLDIDWRTTDPRIDTALEREEQSRTFVPELFAIHPMYATEAEEEIMFLADAFLSHVPEASANVPDYRAWIDDQSFTPAYEHLHRTLQLLQWQKRQRGEVCPRWILKTPAHLGYLDDLVRVLPDAHIVHMHRDPVATIPSGASLNATLWRMHADEVDPHEVGRQWIERMGWTNDRAMATRERWVAPGRCTDLSFTDAVAAPIESIGRIYDNIGLELTADAEAHIRNWHDNQPVPSVERPIYGADEFGLTTEQIRDRFAAYTERFGSI